MIDQTVREAISTTVATSTAAQKATFLRTALRWPALAAQATGTSVTTVRRWAQGVRQPRADNASRLGDAFAAAYIVAAFFEGDHVPSAYMLSCSPWLGEQTPARLVAIGEGARVVAATYDFAEYCQTGADPIRQQPQFPDLLDRTHLLGDEKGLD